jgi:hypothetical protein
MAADSINAVWLQHKSELRRFLLHRTANPGDADDADDALQEVFLKALSQGSAFDQLDNPRAEPAPELRPVDNLSPEKSGQAQIFTSNCFASPEAIVSGFLGRPRGRISRRCLVAFAMR